MKKELTVRPLIFRLVFILILLSTKTGFAPPAPVKAAHHPEDRFQNLSAFEPSECMFDLPLGVVEGQHVICGYVEVPQEHADPDGPTIDLAVVIIKSRDSNSGLDPLFMAQGGPGASTIETYANLLLTNNELEPRRDIILFDQRGTKYSRPNLYCEEFDDLIAETIEQDLTDEQIEEMSNEAVERCRTRLVTRDQIRLSAYNSIENADDIEAIRRALGYGPINLYGVSYGTLLALHYMERHPDSLRSVILDAVVPRQTNFILNSAQTMDRSFSELFESCRSDPACSQAYPDLEAVFYETVEKLNNSPARIPLTDREKSITYQNAVIDGDAFMSGLFQMLYAGSLIPALPRMIYDARDGNFDFFSRIYALLLFDRSISIGMYYSVICAEDADFRPSDQDLTDVRPEISRFEEDEPENLLNTCDIWDVQPLGPQLDVPVESDIPTLLLSGNFDPITPPAYAETAAETLSNRFSFVNASGGHGQALDSACANQLIQAFLDEPSSSPELHCIQDSSGPEYYTPQNTIIFPQGLALINFEQPAGIQLMILILFLGLLLTAVPAIPLIWLLVWMRRRKASRAVAAEPITVDAVASLPGEPAPPVITESPSRPGGSLLSKLAGWLAFIAGPILSLFLIGLGVVLFQMALQNNYQIFYGLPRSSAILFLLPYLFALVSFGMIAAAIHAWLQRDWQIWTRLYFTLLTVSAAGCLVVLAVWGVFTSLF